jgi:hypothetical protein
MLLATELAALYRRDLTRLTQELEAFPDDAILWNVLPGVANSAGNLTLHLEGNLREFIGRQLGEIPYTRQRDAEFSGRGVSRAELAGRIEEVRNLVPSIIAALSDSQMAARYPQEVFGAPISTQQLLFSLYGHLSYHLGQIDYLRRILTEGAAIKFAGL